MLDLYLYASFSLYKLPERLLTPVRKKHVCTASFSRQTPSAMRCWSCAKTEGDVTGRRRRLPVGGVETLVTSARGGARGASQLLEALLDHQERPLVAEVSGDGHRIVTNIKPIE